MCVYLLETDFRRNVQERKPHHYSARVCVCLPQAEHGLDLVLHFGDLSYAVGHGYIWEQFGWLMSSYATKVPVLLGVGNHGQQESILTTFLFVCLYWSGVGLRCLCWHFPSNFLVVRLYTHVRGCVHVHVYTHCALVFWMICHHFLSFFFFDCGGNSLQSLHSVALF